MSLLEVCKICLSRDRNLFFLDEWEILPFEVYLSKFKTNGDKICWECKAVINKFYELQKTALKSEKLLSKYAMTPKMLPLTLSSLSKQNVEIYCIDPNEIFNNTENELDTNIVVCPNKNKDTVELIKNEIKEEGFEEIVDHKDEIYVNDDNDSLINIIANNKTEKSKICGVDTTEIVRMKKYNNLRDNLIEGISDDNILKFCTEKVDFKRFSIKKLNNIKMLEFRENLKIKLLKSNVKFRCDYCLFGFKVEENYIIHMEKYHKNNHSSNLICKICQCYFTSEKKIKHHTKSHYIVYQCSQCSQLSNNKSLANKHYRNNHLSEDNVYNCMQCNITFNLQSQYKSHILSKHHPLDCKVCGKTLQNKYSLKSHMLLHTGMPTSECQICNKIYRGKMGLRIHMNNMHNYKKPENAYCAECNIQFKSANIYKQHLLSSKHHSDKVTCDICKKMFCGKNNLRRHIKYVHQKISNNFCDICGKLFVGSVKLQAHIDYVHKKLLKPKTQECPICKRMFNSKHILKSHMNVHTGERPFRCNACSADFGTSGALYNHTRLVHKRQKIKT